MTPEAEDVLQIDALAAQPGLVHSFSTLQLGSMREPAPRHRLATRMGVEPSSLSVAHLVHGAAVRRLDEPTDPVEGVDVLVTDRAGVTLMARYADCYPILLYGPERGCAALAHAGWRGTAAGVAKVAVDVLCREYGTTPPAMMAGIGPGICGHCYEVGEEVAGRFPKEVVRPSTGGRFLLDLADANRRQLLEAGIPSDRIHVLGACTLETATLPSHRRDGDGRRFAALVALRA
jgi:YfiH family protein